MKSAGRIFFLTLGFLSLALAVIGAFLPLLPTTPFAILAAAAFSRSSERFHRWIVQMPLFGEGIRDWEEKGVIRLRAKFLATGLSVLVVVPSMLIFDLPQWAIISSLVALGLAFAWIWTRPSS